MLRPSRDFPQFRPGGVPSGAPPPMNGPMGGGMNVPMNASMNIPVNNMVPSYTPAPMGGRVFMMPPVSGGHYAYPPPPPTPVPSPHLGPFLPPLQASPFIPPLPPTPPAEAPPPPPPPPPLPSIASPSASSSPPHSVLQQITPFKQALSAQPSKPHDLEILKNIESMAEFVVRNGPRYESMARAKHAGDPKFGFLFENDSGPEAVTNRDFYKWKKEVLRLQLEEAAESKSVSQMDLDSDPARNNLTSQKAQQHKEVPGSPSVSDMDMEDDIDAPSPRRDSTELVASGENSHSPGKESHFKHGGQAGTSKEGLQPVKKLDSHNQGKQAQCRLTGDYMGSLIDNYMSDISEDSDDLEPSKDLIMTETKEATIPGRKEESKLSRQEAADPIELADVGSFEATGPLCKNEVDGTRILEPEADENRGEEQSDFDKGVFQSALEENGQQERRKRSRSHSRSLSESRSRSHSRSPGRMKSRSRSASQSPEGGSKSPPLRGVPQKMLGRSPPEGTSSKDVERGDSEPTRRLKRGMKGGANICLNYARGRCFHGDLCRFQHQGSDEDLQGVDRRLELEENETSKSATVPQNLEGKSSPELDNIAGPTAEVADVGKVNCKAGAEKMELSPEAEVSKRLGSKGETATISAVPSQRSSLVAQDASVQASAEGLSLAPGGAVAVDLPHSEASHPSEVRISSPLSTSETARPSSGNFGSPSKAFRFENPSSLHMSGFSGAGPSMKPSIIAPMNDAYLNTINEADRTFGNSFPGINHAPVQFSSPGAVDNAGLQHSSRGNSGMIHLAAHQGNPVHEYSDLARNYRPSHSSEYRLPFQAQSGSAQNSSVPPSVYPPMSQQHDFSTDTTRGYTPLQHGYTSPFSLVAQQHQSFHPRFPGDVSRKSMFPDVADRDLYGVYPKSSLSFTSQSQSYTPWSMPGSSGISSSKVSEVQSVLGNSSSYSYALTTIPPLPSMIELPGATKPSNPSDQYDPLSDSFEPSVTAGPTSTSFSVLNRAEVGKSFGLFSNTLASQLENVSPGFDVGKGDPAEAAGDPAVGIVENVSPPEDNRDWSPRQREEAVEGKQGQLPSKNKKNNVRGLKMLRSAVADHVKEVLKPTWKEGHMSKDAFKNIVKKAVDKVTAALPSHHIPKSQEKVDQFMFSSRPKISKLVQGYIDKYQKT